MEEIDHVVVSTDGEEQDDRGEMPELVEGF